jgi:hypothetical protein
MTQKLSAREIRGLGLDWPKHALIEEYCVLEDGKVDLDGTLQSMRASRAFYTKQLNQAFNFKQQTGADYADFTDRFDEYARMKRELGEAIVYLEVVIDAATGTDAQEGRRQE